jgi:hypothetical protein
MATPTWQTRERPILEAIAQAEEAGEDARRSSAASIAEWTGLPRPTVVAGLRALVDADMITGQDISTHAGYDLILIRLREKGRRAVGQWPSGDLAGELIRLLEAEAEATADPVERGRIKALISGAVDVGKGTLSDVLAAFIRQSTGLP